MTLQGSDMTEYILETEGYQGTERCEHAELSLTDSDATIDDIQLLPDTFLQTDWECQRTATMIVRISDNYGDDTSYLCDEHAQQQINAFRRDFGN